MVLNKLKRVFFPASDDYPAGCIVEVHCTESLVVLVDHLNNDGLGCLFTVDLGFTLGHKLC